MAIIVGSRTGGFDFYGVCPLTGNHIWLGVNEQSDLDICVESAKEIPSDLPFKVNATRIDSMDWRGNEQFWMGVPFPYDNHIPSDFRFLMWKFNKLWFHREKVKGIDHEIEILDPGGAFVAKVKRKSLQPEDSWRTVVHAI